MSAPLMQARKFYLDTQTRGFVASPDAPFSALDATFFDEDVESIELYFLEPTGSPTQPYTYLDYSGNTVKFAIGTTTPAALQSTWLALSTTVTASITSLVTGGSGSNEVQRITFSQKPDTGGWAIQLPIRTVTVSSVSASVFTAADHGLYSGQSVSLTAFNFAGNSAAYNGSSYFVIRNSKDTFSLANTASATIGVSALVVSGGGTVTLPAVTTGQLSYNATPQAVQDALASAGLVISRTPQIVVTGIAGSEYTLTYANGSANRDYANCSVVGSTLAGAPGLYANLNLATNEVGSLVSSGSATANLEIEVSGGGKRQTYRRGVTLSSDIITSSSPAPLPTITPATSFNLIAPDSSVWNVTIDNSGVLAATKQ
jgi:hypothetical protein